MNYWCNNSVMVVGGYTAIWNLQSSIDAWLRLANIHHAEKDNLSYICKVEGYPFSAHGEIYNVEMLAGYAASHVELFICYHSGYLPEVKFWQETVKRNAPGCKIYWFSFAPRRELCLTNDLEKKYFDFDYCLDLDTKEVEHPLAKEFGHDSITMESNEILEKQLRNVYGPHSLEEMVEMVKKEHFPGIRIYKVMDGSYLDTKE